MDPEVDLDERAPFGPFRLPDQMHARFLRRAVRLARVARDAGANNVFPRRQPTTILRNDMVEIEILPFENAAAVLAGVSIALENVVPGKFDFLLGQTIEHQKQDHTRQANLERNGVNHFGVIACACQIAPLAEAERLERTIVIAHHDLSMALEQKRESPARAADVHRLPEPVQNENLLIQA